MLSDASHPSKKEAKLESKFTITKFSDADQICIEILKIIVFPHDD